MLALLLACAAPTATLDPAACDPRALAPGEVRARQIPCSDELVPGGEGRVGDWLIENAYARYVVRGTYASLTLLDQEGGTLVDAAAPGGLDLLSEYAPDGDRTSLVAENDGDEARLVLPGVTYRLGAEDGALYLDGSASGSLLPLPGVVRTGTTLGDGEGAFFGFDGQDVGGGGRVALEGVTRAALAPEALWPDGEAVSLPTDAETALVLRAGREAYRAPVLDGTASVWLPDGGEVRGEREGCVYEGLTAVGCGWLRLRVADDLGEDVRVLVTDGMGGAYPLPPGGGRVPVGPFPRLVGIWAGPRHGTATVSLPGGDVERTVTLRREVLDDDAILAAMAVEVAPDAGTSLPPEDAATELAAEGAAFAVLLADDEIPVVSVDEHDAIVAVAGSRAGSAWSWPWSPTGRRAAHGAVDWAPLGALDLLAVLEGGQSAARLTVVDTAWVTRARTEAAPYDWDPRPDAFWLASLDDLPTYLALLDDWIDVAPLASRTWIGVGADRNLAAYERGIVDGATAAGTGPRVVAIPAGDGVRVRLSAPRWMGMHTVTVWTSEGGVARPVEGAGEWQWPVPAGAAWVVVVAEGLAARPGVPEPAWVVSSPVWLRRP